MACKGPIYKARDGDSVAISEVVTDALGNITDLSGYSSIDLILVKLPSGAPATIAASSPFDATGAVSSTIPTATTAMTAGQTTDDTYKAHFRLAGAGPIQLTAPGEDQEDITIIIQPALDT